LFAIVKNCRKIAHSHRAKTLMDAGSLDFNSNNIVKPISSVQFPNKPLLMPPRYMPNRKLTSTEGVIAFFHAIAHVEFMAISLAWDLLYRFRGLPEQFYQDWLTVADEEAQHFELIRQHLNNMDCDYGDLPAHGGLWDHAVETVDNLLARLALVPRCMEARGLDVTPGIIAKFKGQGDKASVAILNRILTDEVKHVERGSYWFNYICIQEGVDAESRFQELIQQYYRGGKPKGPFNRKLRKDAGFSDAEIDWLEEN
jgi:uncharacterized ferritin-like protein (DUF455 family)